MAGRTRVTPRQPEIGSVEVVPGLHFTGNGVMVAVADHPSGLAVEVDVVPEGERLIVAAVRASSPHHGKPVTLAALRLIALKPFVRAAVSHAFLRLAIKDQVSEEDRIHNEFVFWGLLSTRDRDRLRSAGPTDETLQWVAVLYRVAVAIDDPPTKSIHAGFEVSLRTATNWVAAARQAGYLPASPTEGGHTGQATPPTGEEESDE